jgi:pyocin large subunit-like protein
MAQRPRVHIGVVIGAAVVLVVLALVLLARPVQHGTPTELRSDSTSTTPAESVSASASESSANASAQWGFRSHELLTEHFRKHGAEFGPIGINTYLGLARKLRDKPVSKEVLEAVRADGVVVRYDRSSGAFIAFDRDGTIRTFFKPNDGEAYYRRQMKR